MCKPCSIMPNCLTCINGTTCDRCAAGYYTNLNTNLCIRCGLLGCMTCLSNNNCTECQSGFFLAPNATGSLFNICFRCSSNITGCAICSSNTSCLACNNDYYINGTTCNKCSNSNFLSSNCLKCYNSSSCI